MKYINLIYYRHKHQQQLNIMLYNVQEINYLEQ